MAKHWLLGNPYFVLTLQTGQYTISVTTTTNSPVSSILNIQSKARTAGQSVITANAWLSDDIHIYGPESRTIVYVSVLKGMSPVINTDVFVNIDSYGKFTSLQLHDNGIGNWLVWYILLYITTTSPNNDIATCDVKHHTLTPLKMEIYTCIYTHV